MGQLAFLWNLKDGQLIASNGMQEDGNIYRQSLVKTYLRLTKLSYKNAILNIRTYIGLILFWLFGVRTLFSYFFSGHQSLLALYLSGTPSLKTGTSPPSCIHLDNHLYILLLCRKTEIYRTKKIRRGPFSIALGKTRCSGWITIKYYKIPKLFTTQFKISNSQQDRSTSVSKSVEQPLLGFKTIENICHGWNPKDYDVIP